MSNLINNYNFWRARGTFYTATESIARARADVANGVKRYDSSPWAKPVANLSWDKEKPGLAHVDDIAGAGLRHVGDVVASDRGGFEWQSGNRPSYWYSDMCGDEGAHGVVYQLPGRDGKARFVAGYVFTHSDDASPTVDLGTVFEEVTTYYEPVRKTTTPGLTYGGYWSYSDSPRDMDAARDAGRAADQMAKVAAESEREYQIAWQAGREFADVGEDIASARIALKALLAERRAIPAELVTVRNAVESKARDLIEEISESRAKRQRLKDGNEGEFYFWTGDARLMEAFNDGADGH